MAGSLVEELQRDAVSSSVSVSKREGIAAAKAEGKYKGRAPTARAKAAR